MKRAMGISVLCLLIAAIAYAVAGKHEVQHPAVSARANRPARAALPASFRPPFEMDPVALGVRRDCVPPSSVEIESLRRNGELERLNVALPAWFQSDPEGVCQWLMRQDDLAEVQPALAAIACRISTTGSRALALDWADLLDDPTLREDTLCAILALGRREGDFSDETLVDVGLPPQRLERILSGAEGD